MNPNRWEKVEQIYNAAMELEPGRRAAYLAEACAGDETLRKEVEALIAQPEAGEGFMDKPALDFAVQALARECENDESAVLVGRSVAHYRIIEKIGEGGMEQAFLAEDTSSAPLTEAPSRYSSPAARPPWWMYLLAATFLAECLIRLYCIVLGPAPFAFRYRKEEGRWVVTVVSPGSTADRIGIKPGDTILAVDGHAIMRNLDWLGIAANLETGRSYRLDIERMGQRLQFVYEIQRVRIFQTRIGLILALWQIEGLLLLATAFLIGFSRPYDFLPRMGSLALAALSPSLVYWAVLPPGYAQIWRSLPPGIGALLWLPIVCSYLVGPLLLTFFVLFPRTIFRVRWPWAIIWLPPLCFVPIFFRSTYLMVFRPLQFYGNLMPESLGLVGTRFYGLYGLAALAALAVNYLRLTDRNDRRRLRLLLIGGGAAVLPGAVRLLIWGSGALSIFRWLNSGTPQVLVPMIFALFPVCFAYSILRHRLLDIHVIIRQGIRYAVTRRALLLAVPVLCVILVIDLLAHGEQPLVSIVVARGWVYAALCGLALVVYWQRKPWMEKLDRRFFREHYNAQQLLRGIIEEIREEKNFERVAPRVAGRIESALHPEFVSVVVNERRGESYRALASAPAGKAAPPLAADSKIITLARMLGKPLEVLAGGSDWLNRHLPDEEIDLLRRARIDLLVPISGSQGGPEALLILGIKRSEEPYTREDRELLQAVAASLALLFDQTSLEVGPSTGAFEECPQCGTCAETGSGRCTLDGAVLTPVTLPRSLTGRYHLERRRGRGGMGTVYEATDRSLERRVAVKVIREEWLYSEGAVKRFQREARAAAAFAHPNVVTVYDFGVEARTRAFLVMELLEGNTLRDELACHGRIPASRTLEIFRCVCSAVDAAHRRNLIHRDLKPENVFLANSVDSGAVTVKVLDFGVAKFLPTSDGSGETKTGSQTAAGVLVGTPAYMSPEQLDGEKPAVSWDLWALSVVAYEILTGALPFTMADRDEWRRSVLSGKYTPLSEYLTDPPVSWQEFFADSLGVNRTKRPASAIEFLRRLEQALNVPSEISRR